MIETLDDVQCPSCHGAGVRRRPQNDLRWFECRYCEGTGIVTEQRFQDW
jgi:DnaJ-class molecular chaperone